MGVSERESVVELIAYLGEEPNDLFLFNQKWICVINGATSTIFTYRFPAGELETGETLSGSAQTAHYRTLVPNSGTGPVGIAGGIPDPQPMTPLALSRQPAHPLIPSHPLPSLTEVARPEVGGGPN